LVDTILEAIRKENLELKDEDILVLASKIVSYSQRRIAGLSDVRPSRKARIFGNKYGLNPELSELILREADEFFGGPEKAVLTLKNGIFVANAGIDCKNAPAEYCVLWPIALKKWVKEFRDVLLRESRKHVGVLIIDSGLIPLRIGTSGLALAVGGFKPIVDNRGRNDAFGRTIMMTRHAVADDLASAAHLLMGEGAELTPVVLVRHAPVDFCDCISDSKDMCMPFQKCLFMNVFGPSLDRKQSRNLQQQPSCTRKNRSKLKR